MLGLLIPGLRMGTGGGLTTAPDIRVFRQDESQAYRSSVTIADERRGSVDESMVYRTRPDPDADVRSGKPDESDTRRTRPDQQVN